MMKYGVTSMTTDRVLTGSWQPVSLHRRNVAEDEIGMTEICAMSFMIEMHASGLKTGVRSVSTLNRSNVKKGTMTSIVPIMTNLADSVLPKGGAMQEESRFFSTT
jgi:hypothetical protein